MPAATTILAASAAVGGGTSLLSAYQQSQAIKAQADFKRDQDNANARIADIQGELAQQRGSTEANKAIRQGQQMVGEQRVALAQQGIDINTGSAGDIQDETVALSQSDADTIKNNAWREAWGFKAQAIESRGNAKMTEAAGNEAAHNTLLIGGLNAVSQFGQAGAYAAKGSVPKAASTASSSGGTPMSDEFTSPEFGSSLKRTKRNYKL